MAGQFLGDKEVKIDKISSTDGSASLDVSNRKIINIVDPTSAQDVASKAYVDSTTASGAPDATTTTKGKVQLAGDLAGTAAAPTVPGLATKVPKEGDVLINQTDGDRDFRIGGKTNDGMVVIRKFFDRIGFGFDSASSDTIDKEFDVNLPARFRDSVEFDSPIVGNVTVEGNFTSQGNTISNSGMQINAHDVRHRLNRDNTSGTTGFDFQTNGVYDWVFGVVNPGEDNLQFSSRLGGEAIRMMTDGRVGIGGATSPSEKLEVNGSVRVNGRIKNVSDPVDAQDSATKYYVDNMVIDGGTP